VYSHLGALVPDYAIALAGLAFVTTLAGQGLIMALLRALVRRSIIILLMAAMMVLATVVAYIQVGMGGGGGVGVGGWSWRRRWRKFK